MEKHGAVARIVRLFTDERETLHSQSDRKGNAGKEDVYLPAK